ncbi:MAG: PAS domain S-box protein, partial [Pseudomonadota bacterium]
DFAPVGYFTLTREALIKEANLTCATLLGVARQKLMNTGFRRFVAPSDFDQWDRHFLSVLQQEEKRSRDLTLRRQDGSIFSANLESIRMVVSPGKTEVHTVVSDVTGRKRAEEALRKSGERYHLVADYNYEWEYWLDEDQTFLYCSPSCLRITGYAPEDFYEDQNLLNKIIHPEDRGIIEKHIHQFPHGNEIVFIEFRLIDRPGRQHWIAHYCQSVTDFKGKPFGRRATNRDITDRKRAEEALRLSEEKLSKAFRTSPDWMTISTLEEGRYVDVNDAFVELSGFSREEALGKTRVELDIWVDPHERDRAVEIIRKEGCLKNFEAKGRLKSGEVRTLLWSAETFDLKSQKYITTTNRDITELRKAQEKIEQTMENYRRSLVGTIEALAVTAEARDPYTAGHQRQVAKLARDIAKEMGLPEDQVNGLHMAGSIHDLGKISVPAEILSKPTKLSDNEFSLIKTHSQVGYEILKDIEFPWPIARIILEHHERMNGSGYPNGLTGDQLLSESKILIVADVVEAIASHRPYRPALGIDAALEEIKKNKVLLYDPAAADVCLRIFREKGFRLE